MSIVQSRIPAGHTGLRLLWHAAAKMADATVVIADADGKVVSVNPDFERTAGYSRYEILGRSVAELEEGDRDPLLFRLIDEAIERGEAALEVCPRGRKEGPAGDETATVHPMCDALGRVTGCVAILHPLVPGAAA